MQAAQKSALQMVLDELEELHREETVALRSMSRERIDDLTDKKLTLWEQLKSVSAESPPGPEQRASLERIKRAALLNQILLHHARDAVRTILQNASGQSLAPAAMRPAAVPGGIRVDFRG